jgi:uncharacterized membrane protein YccC
MGSIPCFLCGTQLHLRTDKNGKVYVICDPCGLQAFVRRKQGMARLKLLQSSLDRAAIVRRPDILFRIQAILQEIEDLKKEIRGISSWLAFQFFFPDPELVRARDALQTRVNHLLSELEELSEPKTAAVNQ